MVQTQTLMQMLSMVGTSLLEAERNGLLESDETAEDSAWLAQLFESQEDQGSGSVSSIRPDSATIVKPQPRVALHKTIGSLLAMDTGGDDQSELTCAIAV